MAGGDSVIGCGNFIRPVSLVLNINFIFDGLALGLVARHLSLLCALTEVASIAVFSSIV